MIVMIFVVYWQNGYKIKIEVFGTATKKMNKSLIATKCEYGSWLEC